MTKCREGYQKDLPIDNRLKLQVPKKLNLLILIANYWSKYHNLFPWKYHPALIHKWKTIGMQMNLSIGQTIMTMFLNTHSVNKEYTQCEQRIHTV